MRRACGTRMGLSLHLDHGEALCGLCGPLEMASRLEMERLRPTPPKPPISDGELHELVREVLDGPERHLRAVS